MIAIKIKWLMDNSEIDKIGDSPTAQSETEHRLAWTCQHWHEQAMRCADQAEGLRRVAVELGLGAFSVNELGEREFHYNGDARDL